MKDNIFCKGKKFLKTEAGSVSETVDVYFNSHVHYL